MMKTIDSRALQIHTDGSCYMEQKRISGCAAWAVYPEHLGLSDHQIVDFGCEESNQNRMELMACLRGLRWALENEPWQDVTSTWHCCPWPLIRAGGRLGL